MEKKINLVELLKKCPKGMELDCTMYEGAELDCVTNDKGYPIKIIIKDNIAGDVAISLTKEGCYNMLHNPKCVIFPKGKTTWEGFEPPRNFKDGDVCYIKASKNDPEHIFIFKGISDHGYVKKYVSLYINILHTDNCYLCSGISTTEFRLATEEEKKKLFHAIKANGFKWNPETKKLEKLIEPKFKVGDRIKNSNNHQSSIVVEIKDDYFIIKTLDGLHNSYLTDKLPFSKQDEWELVPNKFDINTLKPFDKVLVRGDVGQKWIIDFFGFMDNKKGYPFVCVGHYVTQCIPYEGNEHLLGTTDNCEEYYKTWE